MKYFRSCMAAFAAMLAALPANGFAQADAGQAQILLGDRIAFIQEDFPPSGQADIREILFKNPPENLDVKALQVWGRRLWEMAFWQMQDTALHIRLASPMSHRLGHTLIYRVPGWNWQVHYQLDWQAEQADHATLSAMLHIQNPSRRAYPKALISLRSVDQPYVVDKPFGRLELNLASALSGNWHNQSFQPEIPLVRTYALQLPAHIAAAGETSVSLLPPVTCRGVHSVYVWDQASFNVFPSTPGAKAALRHVLRIPNTTENGMGFPLPPGQLQVNDAPQSCFLPATAFPGMLSVDLGPVNVVQAIRASRPRAVPLPDGNRMQVQHILFENHTDRPADILFEEKPASPFVWQLESSSVSDVQRVNDTLLFSFQIPPKSNMTVTYRLLLTIPAVLPPSVP